MTDEITGGCLCGAVRYAFSGAFDGNLCHCGMCRRATGAPFASFATPEDGKSFRWTRGEPGRYRSSNRAERLFCRDCGTPLAFRNLGSDTLDVTIGSLDDPEAAPPTWALGVESKLSWIDHVSELPGKTMAEWFGGKGEPAPVPTRDTGDEM
jgi:hypothetical protein